MIIFIYFFLESSFLFLLYLLLTDGIGNTNDKLVLSFIFTVFIFDDIFLFLLHTLPNASNIYIYDANNQYRFTFTLQ